MTLSNHCSNRIKPKLLREVKTEALLVFIRTTLEEYFEQLNSEEIVFKMGSEEENIIVTTILKTLLTHLQECVVTSTYLRSLIANVHKNATLKILAKQEEPLMVYYDSLIKSLEKNLKNGQHWMPEFIVICLLGEWLLEEEKSVYLYPFLNDIDYLQLFDIYEKIKLNSKQEVKEIIINMYSLSSHLILNLKNCSYKINTKRRKKSK